LIEAWQTAPAPGVLIVNAKRTYRANNVLVWHAALMNSKPFLTADGYSANSGSLFEFNGASPSISNAVCVNCTGMFSSDEPLSTWKETNGASYYQSLSGWNSDSGGGHGSLFAGNGPVSVIRSVFVNNKIRNPRFADLSGETIEAASLNNVTYNWQGRGLEMSKGFQVNAEGSYFIKGPEGVVTGAVVVDNDSLPTARLYFASSNRGMGGVADPPAINNQAASQIITGTRINGSYPAGYNLLDTASVTETEGVELVMACAGARPLNRLPIAQALLDHVLAGTGSLVNAPSQVGGVPKLAQNTTSHGDLPAESGTSANFNTIKAWLKSKSDALLPAGKGCN
jgi:hypothetical protein